MLRIPGIPMKGKLLIGGLGICKTPDNNIFQEFKDVVFEDVVFDNNYDDNNNNCYSY